MDMLLISAVLSCVGAAASIAAMKKENLAKVLACSIGAVASLFALTSGAMALFQPAVLASYKTPFAFADFSLLLNPLSGLLLVVINLLAFVAWIYGLAYFNEYKGKGLGSIGMFMNLFVVSMNFVITSDNAFWFLVFFEMMSLSSYFLVIVDQTKQAMRGGFMYLIMAHVGFLMIMISYFIMAAQTGSFEFQAFRTAAFDPTTASVIFLLAFMGFGCKAGMIPFHSWLPQAHPAAPSNVSALMSGGMIKIGIFGIVKVGLDLLSTSGCQTWWGIVVLIIGAISSVLGVTYALNEHDIKKLLAYHSVENIGIILLGVGIGFIGLGTGNTVLAALGLMAGLYHLINHAMFKGLLFLGAGSVLYSTGSRNMEIMGGLVRAMPVTAMCFLIGSLAISAIPPLNGFMSEWFTYQAMFSAAFTGDALIKFFAGFGAVSLAITGALAVTCFVKAYGVTFLGSARSDSAEKAHEVPASMKFGMIVLAVVCVCLGVFAPWVAPAMEGIAQSILSAGTITVASGIETVNPILGSIVSTPLLAVLMIALIGLSFLVAKGFAKGGVASDREPWACGYLPDASMPPVATTFASEVDMFLHPLYQMRDSLAAQSVKFVQLFQGTVRGADKAQHVGDDYVVHPVTVFVEWLSGLSQKIESGNFRLYIIYIVVALVACLALAVFMR